MTALQPASATPVTVTANPPATDSTAGKEIDAAGPASPPAIGNLCICKIGPGLGL